MSEKQYGGSLPDTRQPKGKAKHTIAEVAQECAVDELEVLVQIVKNPEEPASVGGSAANAVIERDYGKAVTPPQTATQDRLTLSHRKQ